MAQGAHISSEMKNATRESQRIYEQLYAEVALITYKWLSYKMLFAEGPKRLDLLDRTARSFFQLCHDSLLNDVLLSFRRLTDNPKSDKGARISLGRLLVNRDTNLTPSFTTKLETYVRQAEQDCSDFRTICNDEIAHLNINAILNSDLNSPPELTIQKIDKALKNIQSCLTSYSESVFKQSHLFEPISDVRGAYALINYLERGLTCLNEQHDRRLQ